MKRDVVTITVRANRRVTLPQDILRRPGVGPGERVIAEQRPDDLIFVRPADPAEGAAGDRDGDAGKLWPGAKHKTGPQDAMRAAARPMMVLRAP
jgi:bifunctional DNA-binding transcriptional regulator/antitoxin component of YhaV-PrlF toxin-antitoxin module